MMPDGSNGVQRKRQVYCRSYTAMVEGRPRSLPGPFSCGKDRSFHHILLGRPWLHKHRLIPSIYHQCVKERLNGRMIWIATNPSLFEQAEAHLVETMFYDEWAPSGESSVSKPPDCPLVEGHPGQPRA